MGTPTTKPRPLVFSWLFLLGIPCSWRRRPRLPARKTPAMDAQCGHSSIEEFIGTAIKKDEGVIRAGPTSGFIGSSVSPATRAVATSGSLCGSERPHDDQFDEEVRSGEILLRLQDPSIHSYAQQQQQQRQEQLCEGGVGCLSDTSGQLDIEALRRSLSGRPKLKRVCHICGRECPSRHKLQRHLSTHSEDRPYNCRICGKAFKWTEYLAKHMRTQHAHGSNSAHSNGTRFAAACCG